MKIGNKTVGEKEKAYLIADVGSNHEGDLNTALSYVDDVARAGADCVKFQIFKAENLIDPNEKLLPGVKLSGIKTQFERFKAAELSFDDFRKIANHAKMRRIDFTASAWDKEGIDLLQELNVPFIKIGSGDITNIPLLRHTASKKMPLVISTAGATLAEIKYVLNKINDPNIILMHCTFPYPTDKKDINLDRIYLLKKITPLIGYSDHTIDTEACERAAAMGACMVEKHYAKDPSSKQTGDHKVSADFNSFKALAESLEDTKYNLSEDHEAVKLDFSTEAQDMTKKARRAIVAINDIPSGSIIKEEDLKALRPEEKGIPVLYWDEVIGKRTSKDIQKNSFFQADGIENFQIPDLDLR